MNEQQHPAGLLQNVLLCMPRGIWHAIGAESDFSPTVLQSSGLTAFEMETLLLSTGVLRQYGQQTHFSRVVMENLQATFPTTTPLQFQQHRLIRGGKNQYFVCIGRPNQNSTPRTQRQQVDSGVMRPQELDPAVITAIRALCTLRRQQEDETNVSKDKEEESEESDGSDESEESEDEGELSSYNDEGNSVTSMEALVNFALTLRLEETAGARPSRSGEGYVEMTNATKANEVTRRCIMLAALQMGYKLPGKSKAERERIALAACTLISYDHGYKKVVGAESVQQWINTFDQAVMRGNLQDIRYHDEDPR